LIQFSDAQAIYANFDPRLKRKFEENKALVPAGPATFKPVIERDYYGRYGESQTFSDEALNFTPIKLALIILHLVSFIINHIIYIH